MLLEIRCWTLFGKSVKILNSQATELSLPCLLQGRGQHATEAPLHHLSFLSSAGCCQDTAPCDRPHVWNED